MNMLNRRGFLAGAGVAVTTGAASVALYARPHVRLTPSVRNMPAEIETVLRAVWALAIA
jgi:hypothetical protein